MAEKEWDMTVPCGDGMITVRVGAIIMKNGKILMVQGEHDDYLYTVGGRVKFGETADDAIVREVWEETGVRLEIDRLGFVHENYFYGDSASNRGKVIYDVTGAERSSLTIEDLTDKFRQLSGRALDNDRMLLGVGGET